MGGDGSEGKDVSGEMGMGWMGRRLWRWGWAGARDGEGRGQGAKLAGVEAAVGWRRCGRRRDFRVVIGRGSSGLTARGPAPDCGLHVIQR